MHSVSFYSFQVTRSLDNDRKSVVGVVNFKQYHFLHKTNKTYLIHNLIRAPLGKRNSIICSFFKKNKNILISISNVLTFLKRFSWIPCKKIRSKTYHNSIYMQLLSLNYQKLLQFVCCSFVKKQRNAMVFACVYV